MDDDYIIESWTEASKQLVIRIRSPFIVKTLNQVEMVFPLFLPDFGSVKGMVILSVNDTRDISILKQCGIYISYIHPTSYSSYERNFFMDTLNDWGYFGENFKKPDWYSGKSWS